MYDAQAPTLHCCSALLRIEVIWMPCKVQESYTVACRGFGRGMGRNARLAHSRTWRWICYEAHKGLLASCWPEAREAWKQGISQSGRASVKPIWCVKQWLCWSWMGWSSHAVAGQVWNRNHTRSKYAKPRSVHPYILYISLRSPWILPSSPNPHPSLRLPLHALIFITETLSSSSSCIFREKP